MPTTIPYLPPHTTRRLAALALSVPLVLGSVSCGLVNGGSQAAETQGESAEAGNGDNTDASAENGGDDAQGDAAPATGGTVDQALDIEERHPNGVTLRVSRLVIEGNNIALDVEIVNGSRKEVQIHSSNSHGNRLRLVDDASVEYNFVEPDDPEAGPSIALDVGDSLTGTLVFLGPVSGQPEQIRLVVNLRQDDLAGFDLADGNNTSTRPGFVVPIDVAWE